MASTTGFPDATTAGVPAGVTLTPSGSIVINTPGTVSVSANGSTPVQLSSGVAFAYLFILPGVTYVRVNSQYDGIYTHIITRALPDLTAVSLTSVLSSGAQAQIVLSPSFSAGETLSEESSSLAKSVILKPFFLPAAR